MSDPARQLAEAMVCFEDRLWALPEKPVSPPRPALRWTPTGHPRPSVRYSFQRAGA